VQEERRHDPRVLDPMRPSLVPEPEDDRVAVVVRIGVDDPAVRRVFPDLRSLMTSKNDMGEGWPKLSTQRPFETSALHNGASYRT